MGPRSHAAIFINLFPKWYANYTNPVKESVTQKPCDQQESVVKTLLLSLTFGFRSHFDRFTEGEVSSFPTTHRRKEDMAVKGQKNGLKRKCLAFLNWKGNA